MEVIDIVTERAEGARVRRVVVEVGKLSLVSPDSLRFCFEAASQGTAAEGAELVIEQLEGRGRCRVCGAEVTMESPVTACGCGAYDLEWISGDQLMVRSLEIG